MGRLPVDKSQGQTHHERYAHRPHRARPRGTNKDPKQQGRRQPLRHHATEARVQRAADHFGIKRAAGPGA
jgi:hypothetical protein